MTHPRQSKTVHIEVLSDELCLYDWQRKEVHALNPTAAMVWQLCDGQTSPAQMAAHLRTNLETDLDAPQSEALVWASLEQLRKANLLEGEIAKPAGRPVLIRRQMLKLLGGAAAGVALLPVVSSIVAPRPVEAQSPVTVGTWQPASTATCQGEGFWDNIVLTDAQLLSDQSILCQGQGSGLRIVWAQTATCADCISAMQNLGAEFVRWGLKENENLNCWGIVCNG